MKKRDLPIIVSNHQDLLWRRCFDRDIEYRGEKYASYAHLQALYILDNFEKCEKHPEYSFTLECVATLEKFLLDHPEERERVKKYLGEGRMHIPFTGNNIVDSNLIMGESIVRNYLYGYSYLKNNFDYYAEGFDRNDSFGNSAQLPQIAKGFGVDWVYNVVYTPIEGDYWRGLDGSVLCKVQPKMAGVLGGYAKFRPCPVCRGEGGDCPECGGDKIDYKFAELRRSHISIDREDNQSEELQGYVYVSAEELLPSNEIFQWIEDNKDKYNIFFSNYKDMAKRYYKKAIEEADRAREADIHPSPEVNFNNTGVYVTRINTKKSLRRLERRVYALEGMLAMNMLSRKGGDGFGMDEVWRKMLFCMFHDSVTGTMVDRAYDELMDVHKEIGESLLELEGKLFKEDKKGVHTVVNSNGTAVSGIVKMECKKGCVPVDSKGERLKVVSVEEKEDTNLLTVLTNTLSPYSAEEYTEKSCPEALERKVYNFQKKGKEEAVAVLRNDVTVGNAEDTDRDSFVLENEYLRVIADFRGINKVICKKTGECIAEERDYKVGEWILEHDEGSPWATLSTDMRRMAMSSATSLVSCEKSEDVQSLTYKINRRFWAYAVDAGHDITYRVMLIRGEKRLRFEADVCWDCQNHRLRIAFPTPIKGAHIYEIPYGYIERKPYEANCVWPHGASNWASANGDCPAINWAGVSGEGASMALLNKGTPCYRIEEDSKGNKTVLLTVLRSPSVGTYLHEPDSYSMTEYYEMRDAGRHSFEYALEAYDKGFGENCAVISGEEYNAYLYSYEGRAEELKMPRVESEDVRAAAVKISEDKTGIIMRLCEYHGKSASAVITVPEGIKGVYETDLKEDTVKELCLENGSITVDLEPFKLKTLKFVI